MSTVKKLCICAICTALCYALPLGFHAVPMGWTFSPMHIPVLLCGLVCGWPYGLVCGAIGPMLSSLLSGMPAAAQLAYMIPELCAYGLICGLLADRVHIGSPVMDLCCALAPAMILGRVVGGVARAVFFALDQQPYSLAMWASAYFVQSVPGIVLHLIAVPALVLALRRARLIPDGTRQEARA